MSPSLPLIGLSGTACAHPTYHMPMAALGERYIQAIRAAGGMPVIIPPDTPPEAVPALMSRLDGLLLTGGGDIAPEHYGGHPHPTVYGIRPARDALEIALVTHAVRRRVPLLGICRGIQVLNVALGGTLYEDLAAQFPRALPHRRDAITERQLLTHTVHLKADSRLARLVGATDLSVNSLHHQGIRTLAADLRAVGHAPDGLVEAVELPQHPFAIAVQWHPEWLYDEDPSQAALFAGLVAAARQVLEKK